MVHQPDLEQAHDLAADAQGEQVLTLYHILDLRFVQALREQLLEALAKPGPIRLEAGAVQRMSTAAVQTVIAFLTTAKVTKRSVVIPDPSRAFSDAFAGLGLETLLPTSGFVNQP